VRDKKTQKTRGYGFVSFLDPLVRHTHTHTHIHTHTHRHTHMHTQDAAMALKEMQVALLQHSYEIFVTLLGHCRDILLQHSYEMIVTLLGHYRDTNVTLL
jgi:hypothetical protein